MLKLTRREGEEVVIGDPSNPIGVVRIASVKGERVRVALALNRHQAAIARSSSPTTSRGSSRISSGLPKLCPGREDLYGIRLFVSSEDACGLRIPQSPPVAAVTATPPSAVSVFPTHSPSSLYPESVGEWM